MMVVDIDAIHAAREYVLHCIANALQADFLTLYQKNYNLTEPYQFNMEEMGRRRLRNVCLAYLARTSEYKKLCLQQLKEANLHNMTDTIAALRSLSNMECEEREVALNEFYEKWKGDALVVDKWFSI